jgi:Na+/citrate or Na+/malate symporter
VLPVILFYYSTTRYEMDFVPLLAIVAVMGMWRFYEDTRPFPIQSRLATGAIILIVTAATLVSFLLAVSGAGSNFDDINPSLFSFLVNFLPHW